jgi:hypothetical protein
LLVPQISIDNNWSEPSHDNKAQPDPAKHRKRQPKAIDGGKTKGKNSKERGWYTTTQLKYRAEKLLTSKNPDRTTHKVSNRGHETQPHFTSTEWYQCTKGLNQHTN